MSSFCCGFIAGFITTVAIGHMGMLYLYLRDRGRLY
jgi:hypothetical protein